MNYREITQGDLSERCLRCAKPLLMIRTKKRCLPQFRPLTLLQNFPFHTDCIDEVKSEEASEKEGEE